MWVDWLQYLKMDGKNFIKVTKSRKIQIRFPFFSFVIQDHALSPEVSIPGNTILKRWSLKFDYNLLGSPRIIELFQDAGSDQ